MVTTPDAAVHAICLALAVADPSPAAACGALRARIFCAAAQDLPPLRYRPESSLQTGWDRLNAATSKLPRLRSVQAVQLKPNLAAAQLGLGLSLASLQGTTKRSNASSDRLRCAPTSPAPT